MAGPPTDSVATAKTKAASTLKHLKEFEDDLDAMEEALSEEHGILSKLVKQYSGNRTLGVANEAYGRVRGKIQHMRDLLIPLDGKLAGMMAELEDLKDLVELTTETESRRTSRKR